ncbi:MAG: 50S ribosomal protein L13 [Firmicutes bacterium]|nr:50S ribosomal protein L13 [Bacillota bacterium]
MIQRTHTPAEKSIERRWYVVDAEGQVLGRLATRIAGILRGKHKPIYTPHLDTGDYIVVVNAEKVVLTGKKPVQKKYYRHTLYPGGLKVTTLSELLKKKPERVIQTAVKGMLPHNRLGRKLFKKLHIYSGPIHPHQAQMPVPLDLSADSGKDREKNARGA